MSGESGRQWVLAITSFGTPDSVHFYGEIHQADDCVNGVRIERILTAPQARELQHHERQVAKYAMFEDDRKSRANVTYHEGDVTERFVDRDALTAAAVEKFHEIAAPGDALFMRMAWLRDEKPLAVQV